VKVEETNGSVTSVHLESNSTLPLIVTTHENQWAAAEGSLFENNVFGAHVSSRFLFFIVSFSV
jgi:hypothetical protein